MREISKELILLAANGDMGAFEEIYRAFSSTVYTVALGVTRDRSDAEEVTQDVFMKAYRNLKSFRFGSSLGTWIYRITVNAAINVYRRSARRKEFDVVDGDMAPYANMDIKAQAVDGIGKNEAAEIVGKILDKLSPEHRSCIVLREIEGLDYKDMANALGIPLNTVRSRLKRAREAMASIAGKGVPGYGV
jgi:RNA polymerase sigma-70 factor (ECF subfamily)